MLPTFSSSTHTPHQSSFDSSHSWIRPELPTYKSGHFTVRLKGWRRFYPLIKALRSSCQRKKGLESLHRTLRSILGPVVGLAGFVIHDIYHINCHIEKWWQVAKTEPHIIFTALRGKQHPSLSEVLNNHISADQLTSHSNRLVFAQTLTATNSCNYNAFIEIHPEAFGIFQREIWRIREQRLSKMN